MLPEGERRNVDTADEIQYDGRGSATGGRAHQAIMTRAPAVADEVYCPIRSSYCRLPGSPFFPGQVQPVAFNPDNWQATLDAIAEQGSGCLGLAFVDAADQQWQGDCTTIPQYRLRCRLHRPPGAATMRASFWRKGFAVSALCAGSASQRPFMVAQVEYLRSQGAIAKAMRVKAYAMAIIAAIKELLPFNPLYSEELKQHIGQFNPNQPSLLADFAAALTTASGDQLQDDTADTCL